MGIVNIKTKLCRAGAKLPTYANEHAVGADIRAHLSAITTKDKIAQQPNLNGHFNNGDASFVMIRPGERALIPTGVIVELPPGFELQVRSRSGLALKEGLMVLNSPGTIDPDYRGEIGIIVLNTGRDAVMIRHDERLAQLVVAPVIRGEFTQVDEVSQTYRGDAGYGSTGKS